MNDLFSDAKDIAAVVFQAVGAGSVCWENPGGAGVFDSDRARQVGDAAVARINELLARPKLHAEPFG